GPYQPLEGSWSGDLVIIEFPSMELARSWYESEAYRAIRTLRTGNTEGDVLLVHGVPDGHRGVDILGVHPGRGASIQPGRTRCAGQATPGVQMPPSIIVTSG